MDEKMAWDIYYAAIVSMTLHPGYTREGTAKPSLENCAELADQMLKYRPKANV